jgi:cytochrome P450
LEGKIQYAGQLAVLSCTKVQESMRLRPVVPMIFRKAVQDMCIGPYFVPQGTFFIVHIMATQTSDRNWERAQDFIPVRAFALCYALFLRVPQLPSLLSR